MTVQGTRHRPTGVDEVRVSEASRAMAKAPALKFADNNQEYEFFVAEKRRIEGDLSRLKDDLAKAKRDISAKSRNGADWYANSSAIDADYATKRSVLTKELQAVLENIRSVKLRIQQQRARDDQRSQTGDKNAIVREDGSINQGVVLLLILRELERLNDSMGSPIKEA